HQLGCARAELREREPGGARHGILGERNRRIDLERRLAQCFPLRDEIGAQLINFFVGPCTLEDRIPFRVEISNAALDLRGRRHRIASSFPCRTATGSLAFRDWVLLAPRHACVGQPLAERAPRLSPTLRCRYWTTSCRLRASVRVMLPR